MCRNAQVIVLVQIDKVVVDVFIGQRIARGFWVTKTDWKSEDMLPNLIEIQPMV